MKSILSIIAATCAVCASAQTAETDSVSTRDLNEVVVESSLQSTSAKMSTYIPTSKQKNASQTGTDLLNRMAIPQLSVSMGNSVQTVSGKQVDIFIDYLPASEQDLSGMRMTDVKKVEYYDFPDDPRFQGKAHVVNFIMQKYEYGGYLKTSANEFLISNTGQLNLYSKIQYKKMTYDVAVGGYYRNDRYNYNNTYETFRLPQADGSVSEFERISVTDDAVSRRRYFWPTFKALYHTDKIVMSNTIGATIDNYPKKNTSGSLYFVPSDFQRTDFVSESNHSNNYVTYSGYWNFILPHGNTINFNPYYSYSYTKQHSRYVEVGSPEYINGARDYSHSASGSLQYQHNFGKCGDLTVAINAIYTNNRTHYSGTATETDRMTTLRIGPGVAYSYSSDKLYGRVGVGFTYDRSDMSGETDHNTQPWMDLSLQYAFNDKNSLNAEFHHMSAMPSLSYRSPAIIQSNPLMRYTGNPNLTPYHSYDFGMSYQWMPDNRFSFSVYGYGYAITNRFAYAYEASSEGILRTVQQPAGKYIQGNYGLNATGRFLDNKLQITGHVWHTLVRNGAPFNLTGSHINWYMQVYYYLDQWYFGAQYFSPSSSPDGYVSGTWVKERDVYTGIVGWGNASWSFRAMIANPFRWHWREGTTTLHTSNYDYTQYNYSPNKHCFIYLSATYTFGFGKKINVGNEASQQTGAGNAILR